MTLPFFIGTEKVPTRNEINGSTDNAPTLTEVLSH